MKSKWNTGVNLCAAPSVDTTKLRCTYQGSIEVGNISFRWRVVGIVQVVVKSFLPLPDFSDCFFEYRHDITEIHWRMVWSAGRGMVWGSLGPLGRSVCCRGAGVSHMGRVIIRISSDRWRSVMSDWIRSNVSVANFGCFCWIAKIRNTITMVIFCDSIFVCNDTLPLRFTLALHNCIFCNNHKLPSLIAVTVSISTFTHHVREKFGETQ